MSLRDLRAVRDVDPLEARCPICNQPKGQPCVWVAGQRGGRAGELKVFPHATRRRKAIAGVDWGKRSQSSRCSTCGEPLGVGDRCGCQPPEPTIRPRGGGPEVA